MPVDIDAILAEAEKDAQKQRATNFPSPETVTGTLRPELAITGGPVTQGTRPLVRSWEQRNATTGVPLRTDFDLSDVVIGDEAVPVSAIKAGAMMRRDPADRLGYLQNFYGKGNVRLADDETPIIMSSDEAGKPVEVPLYGPGFKASELPAHLASHSLEIIGGLAGARVAGPARAKGIWNAVKRSVTAGIGQAAGGVAQDVAVSSAPLSAIALQRAEEIPGNIALDLGLQGAAKVAGKALSPLGSGGSEVQKDLLGARAHFMEKFGEEYPLTIAEQTGSTLFGRIEASMSRLPGASRGFENIKRKQTEALSRIMNKMVSSKLDPKDVGMLKVLEEDVGEGAIAALLSKIEPVQSAELAARNSAVRRANEVAMDEFAQATGPTRQMFPNAVGGAIRTRAVSDLDQFMAEAARRYEYTYSLPGGRDKILDATQLGDEAKGLLDKFPSVEHSVTTPTGLVGPSGQPITTTVRGTTLQPEFVPPGVKPIVERLSKLQGLQDPTLSLEDLVQMRTEVSDEMKRGTALANVSTKYLTDVHEMLSRTIERETGKLPGGQLKAAWEDANRFYREGDPGFARGRSAFEEKNIGRLFKTRDSGGFVADEAVVRNINDEEYNSFKQFLGPQSKEFIALKRGMMDELIEKSKPPGSDLFDPDLLRSKLDDFLKNKRAIAIDILGPDRFNRLNRLAGAMEALKPGETIEAREFAEILASNSPIKPAVEAVMKRQKAMTELYRSSVMKDIGEGRLGQTFNSQEFMDRLYGSVSPKELQLIKDNLKDAPEVWEQVQRKVAERLLFDASKVGRAGVRELGEVPKDLSSSLLERSLGDDTGRTRLKIILGDTYDDMVELTKLTRGVTEDQAFRSFGGLSQAQQITGMVRHGPASYAPEWVQQWFVAAVYTNPITRKLFANQAFSSPAAQAALVNAAIASEPIAKAAAADMGYDADTFMSEMAKSVTAYLHQGPPQAAVLRNQDYIGDILRAAEREAAPRVTPIPQQQQQVNQP